MGSEETLCVITTAHPWETDTLGYPMLLICLYHIWCISVVLYIYPRELWCIKRVSFHAVTTFLVLVWLTW
jgi:hypothetical protein